MSTAKRAIWVLAGFVAGLLAAGLPYWSVPYNQVSNIASAGARGSLLAPIRG